MSRVLLADDSPHAQRMGERILREQGLDVLAVTDGEAAMANVTEWSPDLILADAFLPSHSGYDLCEFVKRHPDLQHTRVIITAGLLEPLDEERARRAGSDAILKKPFEASVVIDTIRPFLATTSSAKKSSAAPPPPPPPPPAPPPRPMPKPDRASFFSRPSAPEPDPERIRAAVTIALDAAMPKLIDEITARVLVALKKPNP